MSYGKHPKSCQKNLPNKIRDLWRDLANKIWVNLQIINQLILIYMDILFNSKFKFAL